MQKFGNVFSASAFLARGLSRTWAVSQSRWSSGRSACFATFEDGLGFRPSRVSCLVPPPRASSPPPSCPRPPWSPRPSVCSPSPAQSPWLLGNPREVRCKTEHCPDNRIPAADFCGAVLRTSARSPIASCSGNEIWFMQACTSMESNLRPHLVLQFSWPHMQKTTFLSSFSFSCSPPSSLPLSSSSSPLSSFRSPSFGFLASDPCRRHIIWWKLVYRSLLPVFLCQRFSSPSHLCLQLF